MRHWILGLVLLILTTNTSLYAQDDVSPQPPLNGSYNAVLFPNVTVSATLPESGTIVYLVWTQAGDEIEAELSRLEGDFEPLIQLKDGDGQVLAEGTSNLYGTGAELTPYTLEKSDWYFLVVTYNENISPEKTGSFELTMRGTSPTIFNIVIPARPPQISTETVLLAAQQTLSEISGETVYLVPLQPNAPLTLTYDDTQAAVTVFDSFGVPLPTTDNNQIVVDVSQWVMVKVQPLGLTAELSISNEGLATRQNLTSSKLEELATPTLTLTPSVTFTPTLTFTPSATFTASATFTPTLTLTPSATFTPSPTLTTTPTFTLTPTLTPSIIPSITPTATLAPVARNADWRALSQTFNTITLMRVPPGCFMMGSQTGDDDEKPVHEQCFDTPFWIGQTEVTNLQYAAFIDAGGYNERRYWTDTGWAWKGSREAPENYDGFTDDNQPRVGVSWYEAVAYTNWLTEQWRAIGIIGKDEEIRLPTESEWEYAARGPDGLTYPWGNTWDETRANTSSESDGYGNVTAPVGSYPLGASWVGALDMSGNTLEWILSGYVDYPYVKTDGRNSVLSNITRRVLRGGSWRDNPYDARAVYRAYYDPYYRSLEDFGFRLLRDIDIAESSSVVADRPDVFECPGALFSDLQIGERFIVPVGDGPSTVFNAINSERIAFVDEGVGGVITSAPVCALGKEGNLVWYEVQTDNGYTGYMSEGYPHSRVAWITSESKNNTRVATPSSKSNLPDCPGAPPTYIEIGQTVVVDFSDKRSASRIMNDQLCGANCTIAQTYDGETLDVIDGPRCFNRNGQNVWSWYIYHQGWDVYGWVLEGTPGDRWLCELENPDCGN